MIQLTKRDGEIFLLNPDLIERIEEAPDTHITLANGHHYLVKEPASLVVERIVAYEATVLRRSTFPARRRRRLRYADSFSRTD
jgi:flagellar protein FlbD